MLLDKYKLTHGIIILFTLALIKGKKIDTRKKND